MYIFPWDTLARKYIFTLLFLNSYSAHALMGDLWKSDSQTISQYFSITKESNFNEGYVVYTYGNKSDLIISEYVNSLGFVFAVRWEGVYLPNFEEIISKKYIKNYIENNTLFTTRSLSITKDGFVLKSLGKMRNFRGYAYDVKLLPKNFSLNHLQ